MTKKMPFGSGLPARLWNTPYLLVTLVALAWAGNALVGRAARDLVPPFTLAFVRWAGALTLVAPFAWPHLKRDAAALRAKAGIVIVLGLLGVATFNALLYTGLHYTTATNGVLIQAAIPPLIVAFAFLLFRETVGWRQLAAVAISASGVVIIVCQGSVDVLLKLRFNHGDGLILIAVLAWAIYTVLLRLRPAVNPLSFMACVFAIGVAAMGPASHFELTHGHRIIWSIASLGAFAYVSVVPSLLAYLFYTRAVDLVGPARASQAINLMPAFGAVLAVILLHEPLAAYDLIGGVLIVSGVIGFAVVPAKVPADKSSKIALDSSTGGGKHRQ
jgi:drug/metabolite transporter (DMT)-like permease